MFEKSVLVNMCIKAAASTFWCYDNFNELSALFSDENKVEASNKAQ